MLKTKRKLFTLLICIFLIFSMSITAFANEPSPASTLIVYDSGVFHGGNHTSKTFTVSGGTYKISTGFDNLNSNVQGTCYLYIRSNSTNQFVQTFIYRSNDSSSYNQRTFSLGSGSYTIILNCAIESDYSFAYNIYSS